MKKTIALLFAVASVVLFAGQNDLLITFSTPGPDKYADGKDVLVGECYALFYTFADGTDSMVLVYPGAEEIGTSENPCRRCPPVVFIVDEDTVGQYTDGTWSVRLLDTRDFTNGATGTNLTGKTTMPAGNIAATVTSGFKITETFKSADSKTAVSSGDYTIPKPVVTGIKVEGANVFVSVGNIVPCMPYTLLSATDGKTFDFVAPEDIGTEKSTDATSLTLSVPKQGNAQFYKVSTKE